MSITEFSSPQAALQWLVKKVSWTLVINTFQFTFSTRTVYAKLCSYRAGGCCRMCDTCEERGLTGHCAAERREPSPPILVRRWGITGEYLHYVNCTLLCKETDATCSFPSLCMQKMDITQHRADQAWFKHQWLFLLPLPALPAAVFLNTITTRGIGIPTSNIGKLAI